MGDGYVQHKFYLGRDEQKAAFFAQKSPRIEQLAGVVIAEGQHPIRVAPDR